jgi:hypothetical protein
MRARTNTCSTIGFLGVLGLVTAVTSLAPGRLQAQELPPDSRMRLGLTLVPMPFGSLTLASTIYPGVSVSGSVDAKVAFGIMPSFDYLLTRYFFVGVAPQLTFDVKPQNATGDAARELDLLIRLGANAPIADTIQLYGYIAPGYSVVMLPHLDDGTGFCLGFHGGAMFDLTPKAYLAAELGYQFGYQSTSILGQSVDTKTNYFHLGLGAGVHL